MIENNCFICYVGQTGRTIACRLMEHKRHTENGQHHLFAICEHIHPNPGHNINFEKTQV